MTWARPKTYIGEIPNPERTIPGAAECKRLYVNQQFRRRDVAEALIAQMEHAARAAHYSAIYLDSKDDLHAAIALYERAGYTSCEHYNDNPQATVFMRKALA